ncbi:nitric oxide reductase activation protein NorD [Skermania piniformis]|uniref:VWA domain-containing protein n=1 Tax=Skermania pinensis TaxID=39122 RepID=A0ABX8SG01_9ACTN|nr:VWA domain-containing protein [Skermania piniformis]QXQ15360.1 VWA domain-containing protein [Skermania piniformis]
MNADPDRFRLLASAVAGRSVAVAAAPPGEAAYTNGRIVFVSAGASPDRQRREVLVQSALIGAGSLREPLVRGLRARRGLARRYLAVEGPRALGVLADRVPIIATLDLDVAPGTDTAEASLELARGRAAVPEPPEWFGVIRPSRILSSVKAAGKATQQDLRLEFDLVDLPESEDEDEAGDRMEDSKILKLFENPVLNSQLMSDFLRKIFGNSRSPGDTGAGGELTVRAVRRVEKVGADARPMATPIRFTDTDRPGATVGVGGALYPEWDRHNQRYRPNWCRVIDFPSTAAADVSAAAVEHDDVLRRRLSRVGLGPRRLRARSDGTDLDLEALVDLHVDLRSGWSPPEHVYIDRRNLERNLGVLILVDASGSATDTDPAGLAVHDHQRRAAATLAVTLEELGDRVAVYAFRSQGRHAVHLPAIKSFGQRFGALHRARLNQLQPSGYTRLGAGIRGAAAILAAEAGTPNRLLLVLSDGHPYDDGYEAGYAEADTCKALEEVRADGIATLCLAISATTPTDALERTFGATGLARATALADLSPRMDELFLAALRELAAPRPTPSRS